MTYTDRGRGSAKAEARKVVFERWEYDSELGCLARVADYRSTPERIRVEVQRDAPAMNKKAARKRAAKHERKIRRASRR